VQSVTERRNAMSVISSLLSRRTWWTALIGLSALATWVVAFGVGWRAWILTGPDLGIVAHVTAVGVDAAPWMIVAAILTLTTVVMGIGVSLVRHLVDGPVASLPTLPTLDEREPQAELPEASAPKALDASQGDDELA
jgi:hypothetical protein